MNQPEPEIQPLLAQACIAGMALASIELRIKTFMEQPKDAYNDDDGGEQLHQDIAELLAECRRDAAKAGHQLAEFLRQHTQVPNPLQQRNLN